MQFSVESFTIHKRFALKISRGTTAQTTNVWLRLESDGVEGWGEASPFSMGGKPQTTADILEALKRIQPIVESLSPWDRQILWQKLADFERENNYSLPSAARAAVDMALYDWLGKKVKRPLWQLWGLSRDRIVPTSVTIGISSPEAARDRFQAWMAVGNFRAVKVKLGSPEGVAADQAMFSAIYELVSPQTQLTVDANGGWTLGDAVKMCDWLAQRGVIYVEQPLAVEAVADLAVLYERSPLPIFVDESCLNSGDILRLSDRVHGINIKLMKAGGLTEVMQTISAARACGLQVMFGCYSDSTLANSAMAQLSPLADYLDLDSHLNLMDDPFQGAMIKNGCLIPNDLPGLGVQRDASDG